MKSNFQRRDSILARIRKSALKPLDKDTPLHTHKDTANSNSSANSNQPLNESAKVDLLQGFIENMQKNKASCYYCLKNEIPKLLLKILKDEKITSLMLSNQGFINDIAKQCQEAKKDLNLRHFDDCIENESLKKNLFSVDASLEQALAGLAKNGSIVAASSKKTPRSLSLAPPLHIALVDSADILADLPMFIQKHILQAFNNESQADRKSKTLKNYVIISGPSKTADIEMTLVQGMHGPLKLIVIVYKKFT